MHTRTKTRLTAAELKGIYSTKLGVARDRVIIHKDAQLGWTATIIAQARDASRAAEMAEQLSRSLRTIYELEDDDVPKLASEPLFDQRQQTVFFDVWIGTARRAASLKVQQTDAQSALRFFYEHWRQIGAMARKTPPIDGEVRLEIVG